MLRLRSMLRLRRQGLVSAAVAPLRSAAARVCFRPASTNVTRLHVGDPRMSQVVIHNSTIYLSGQVPADYSSPIKDQTQQVLDKVDGLLEEAGSDKSRLLSAQIWVKDMADFDEMNEVRYRSSARARAHTHGPHGPVTSCDEDMLFFDWTRAGR